MTRHSLWLPALVVVATCDVTVVWVAGGHGDGDAPVVVVGDGDARRMALMFGEMIRVPHSLPPVPLCVMHWQTACGRARFLRVCVW